MATVRLSQLFQELFNKKTCIYLPHNHKTFNENCVVWETKYFFRKEVYSSCGKFRLQFTATNEHVDIDEEEVNKNDDFKPNPTIEKLRPVEKNYENVNGSARNRGMIKSKLGKKNYDQSNGQGNVKNGNISNKNRMLAGSANRMKVSNTNSDRNTATKTSDKNETTVGQFANVGHKNNSGRNAYQLNASGGDASQLNANGRNVSQLNVIDGEENFSNKYVKLDKRTKNLSDDVNAGRNSMMTHKSRMAGGQLLQNIVNAVGDDAVRVSGTSNTAKYNLNQLSAVNHSDATSKITQRSGSQHGDIQNMNAGSALNDSTNSKFLLHLLSNAYNNDQRDVLNALRNKYGIYLPSESGVRSSFPSSCNKTNLLYDERQKTQNFGSQCTEKSFWQVDNKTTVSDIKTASQTSQTDRGIFILKITTGRRNQLNLEQMDSYCFGCNS